MTTFTKAELISANPGLGLKASMLKADIEKAIKAASKKPTTSKKTSRSNEY